MEQMSRESVSWLLLAGWGHDTSLGSRTGSDKSTDSSKPRAAVKPLARHADNDGQSDDHTSNNDSGSGSGAATPAAAAASTSVYANIPFSAKEEASSSPTKSNAKTSRDKQPKPPLIAATPGPSGPLYENFELADKASPQKPAQGGASTPSKGKATIAPRGPRKSRQEEDALAEEEEDVYNNEDLYACYSSVRSFSVLDAFQKHLLDCLAAPETLAMEFEVGVFTVYVSLRLLLRGHHDHDIIYEHDLLLFSFPPPSASREH